MIRVLVVDDNELIRIAVSSALSTADGIEVVGNCCDGREAIAAVAHSRPDVVVMDLSMPHVDGVEATRRIVASNPDTKIVILTSQTPSRMVSQALSAGAISCVYKNTDAGAVVRAVWAAAGIPPGLRPSGAGCPPS